MLMHDLAIPTLKSRPFTNHHSYVLPVKMPMPTKQPEQVEEEVKQSLFQTAKSWGGQYIKGVSYAY